MRHASHSRLPTSGSYALLNMQWKWHMSGSPAATPSRGCLLRGIQWRCCRRLIEEGRHPDSQNRHLWHLLHLNPMYSKVPCVWGLITSIAGWRHRIIHLPEDPGNTMVSSGELRPESPPTREDSTPQKGMDQLLPHNLGYQRATWSLDRLDSINQCATHCKGQE